MRYAAILLVALTLASCRYFEDDAEFGYSRTGLTTPSAFTTADVRIITQRVNPLTGREIICTEPSPDVAKAISTAFSASGSGGNGTATGNISFSGANAEAVAELAGRSTALLGLRDGLYRACEAYANGVIGSDTYALIVSRYGQLMTTLFLGQDVADAARAQASTQANSPANSTTDPGSSPSGNTQQQKTTTGDAGQTPSSATAPPASTSPPPASTPTAVASTNAAAVIGRMNEDYMNLDLTDLLHTLSVVCINRQDPTVSEPADPNKMAEGKIFRQTNPWLDSVCLHIASTINSEADHPDQALSILTKAALLAPPINPMTAAAPGGNGKTTQSPAGTKNSCVAMSDAQLVQVQQALIKSGQLKDEAFTPDNNVPKALLDYQSAQHISDAGCKPGQIGSGTLSKLIPKPPKAAGS
jgi:hypothetical protein